jgi:hypothetical protein
MDCACFYARVTAALFINLFYRLFFTDMRQAPWNSEYSESLFHIARPPSTSILTPVMNDPSSLAKNNAVFATSIGSVSRPSGTLATNFSLFSGVSGTPTKLSNSPVPDSSGAIALTRMLFDPYSAANPLVAYIKVR